MKRIRYLPLKHANPVPAVCCRLRKPTDVLRLMVWPSGCVVANQGIRHLLQEEGVDAEAELEAEFEGAETLDEKIGIMQELEEELEAEEPELLFDYYTRNTVVLAMGTFLIVNTIFYEAVRETVGVPPPPLCVCDGVFQMRSCCDSEGSRMALYRILPGSTELRCLKPSDRKHTICFQMSDASSSEARGRSNV